MTRTVRVRPLLHHDDPMTDLEKAQAWCIVQSADLHIQTLTVDLADRRPQVLRLERSGLDTGMLRLTLNVKERNLAQWQSIRADFLDLLSD